MKETEMFEPVKKLLYETIFCSEVYAEVGNVDVLGIKGATNIIVEMKTSLNFKVIEQAYRGLKYAHYVYIAVPITKSSFDFVYNAFLRQRKIGLIMVSESSATIMEPAKFNHIKLKNRDYIRNLVDELCLINIAGSKSGEKETRYSRMMKCVKSYMQHNGWVSVDDILNHCETYYAQPKPSMVATLKADYNADWCESKIINGKLHFRYKKSVVE